jgi:hypothetical protein
MKLTEEQEKMIRLNNMLGSHAVEMVAFQSKWIRIARGMQHSDTLIRELSIVASTLPLGPPLSSGGGG